MPVGRAGFKVGEGREMPPMLLTVVAFNAIIICSDPTVLWSDRLQQLTADVEHLVIIAYK